VARCMYCLHIMAGKRMTLCSDTYFVDTDVKDRLFACLCLDVTVL